MTNQFCDPFGTVILSHRPITFDSYVLHQILGTQVDAFLIWWDQLANWSYSMQRLEQEVILAIHPHTIISMSPCPSHISLAWWCCHQQHYQTKSLGSAAVMVENWRLVEVDSGIQGSIPLKWYECLFPNCLLDLEIWFARNYERMCKVINNSMFCRLRLGLRPSRLSEVFVDHHSWTPADC